MIYEMAAAVIKTNSIGDSLAKYSKSDLESVIDFLEKVRNFHSRLGNESESYYLSTKINNLVDILRFRRMNGDTN